MEELQEYQNLVLLAANFGATSDKESAHWVRPMHIVNQVRIPLGKYAALFEPIDDDTRALLPNSRTVGSAQDRAREEGEPRVMVI